MNAFQQNKGVVAMCALGFAAVGAVSVARVFNDAAAAPTVQVAAPVETQFGPETGALTMEQRIARGGHHQLGLKCINEITATLKDPNSFALVDIIPGARGDRKIVYTVTYSAINSFRGRSQERNVCTYTL